MNFIHIADVHLGMKPDAGRPWSETRGEELWESFRNILKICNEKRVDLLLIAGDLFHHQPLKRDIKEVNYLFSTLKHTKVVLIAGNHDHIQKNSYYRNTDWDTSVTILAGKEIQSVYFPELETEVWGFSYWSNEIKEARYDEVKPGKEGKIQILLAHGGDEKHIPIDRKKLSKAGFHYVALGHIHKPEMWLEEKMAYSGSLEPTDRNDMGKRGYIIGQIDLDGETAITQFKLVSTSVREYISLRARVSVNTTNVALLDHLSSAIEQNGEQNIYKITLEGHYDPETLLNPALLYRIGNVVQVSDETKPEYDINLLLDQHKDDVIGMYIEEFLKKPMDEQQEKALFYGINALLQQEEIK